MKTRFESIARMYIKREGIEDLLDSLSKTDFYVAPASTRYHDSHEGGLVKHSLKVFDTLKLEKELYDLKNISMESLAIVSLFHDICKIGFYKKEMRNTKDERGKWIQVPYYTVDDKFPLGHGHKSVIMLYEFIKLNTDEIMAIAWHMGLSVPKEEYKTLGEAFTQYPLSLYLHIADMKATYL